MNEWYLVRLEDGTEAMLRIQDEQMWAQPGVTFVQMVPRNEAEETSMDALKEAKRMLEEAINPAFADGYGYGATMAQGYATLAIAEQLTRIADALGARNSLLAKEAELYAAIARGGE